MMGKDDPPEASEGRFSTILNSSTRNFIMVAHRARTDTEFNLNDLCGSAGRLDGVLRCINSALFLSHGMRRDTSIHVIILGPEDPPKVLTVEGRSVRYLNPDERSTAALVRNALGVPISSEVGSIKRSSPGIHITRGGLELVLSHLRGDLYLLDEGGTDISGLLEASSLVKNDIPTHFILSDDMDLTENERSSIMERAVALLSVSPSVLHADHAITVLHNFLDRNYSPSPRDVLEHRER